MRPQSRKMYKRAQFFFGLDLPLLASTDSTSVSHPPLSVRPLSRYERRALRATVNKAWEKGHRAVGWHLVSPGWRRSPVNYLKALGLLNATLGSDLYASSFPRPADHRLSCHFGAVRWKHTSALRHQCAWQLQPNSLRSEHLGSTCSISGFRFQVNLSEQATCPILHAGCKQAGGWTLLPDFQWDSVF